MPVLVWIGLGMVLGILMTVAALVIYASLSANKRE